MFWVGSKQQPEQSDDIETLMTHNQIIARGWFDQISFSSNVYYL